MDGSADTLRFEEMRAAMVASQLRTSAVDDLRVVKVMGMSRGSVSYPPPHVRSPIMIVTSRWGMAVP